MFPSTSLLAYVGNPASLSRMLSGRGFWIALAVVVGTVLSAWRSRQHVGKADAKMRARQTVDHPAQVPHHSRPLAVVREAMEAELGTTLSQLRKTDKVSDFLLHAQVRSMIDRLEETLDVDLPDAKTVSGLSIEQFGALIERISAAEVRSGSAGS